MSYASRKVIFPGISYVMLMSKNFSRPERASPNPSPLPVGEKISHNRIWLSTAGRDYNACPAKYPGENKVPTLHTTNMNPH
jgi:hypothetical protein